VPRAVSRRPRYPPERGCVRDARPCRSACPPMESLPHTGMGCADDRWPPNTDPATAVPADRQALPARRPRPKTLPCSRRRGPAWLPSARPLAGFAGRQIRAATTATPDDAGWLVLVEDLEQLGTAIGLERVARVAGKTERIGRPRPLADLDHDLRNVRSPGDLPAPPARTGTRAHVPAQVRTDLPPINARLRQRTRRRASRARRPQRGPGRPSGAPESGAAPRGLGLRSDHSQSLSLGAAQVAAVMHGNALFDLARWRRA
jgi:hypothetical protein